MVESGLDRLLAAPARLAGRRWALLGHAASVDRLARPAHLALARLGFAPAALFGPEHGYYGVEQDMIAAGDQRDPWTGVPVLSLYGTEEGSLVPSPDAFRGLDLLVVDLQDVGSRYYTFAATAVWAGAAATAAGCEVWVLDRPNPLGGERIEGGLREQGFSSFVGAFAMPVRHGLTLAEIVLGEARAAGWAAALEVWPMAGWRRSMAWMETGLPWIAPSPNMPTPTTALVYPGACLVEATELSEGRGTTRPFELLGAPHLDPMALADRLAAEGLPGVRFLPAYFRPQFQKHAGELCGGVQWVVEDAAAFAPYATGVAFLAAARSLDPERFAWRKAPYEFVADRPAIDLLTGGTACRRALEAGAGGAAALAAWRASWAADEAAFRVARRNFLLYPEETS